MSEAVALVDSPADAAEMLFGIEIGNPVWITRECARDLTMWGLRRYAPGHALGSFEMAMIDYHSVGGWNIRRVHLSTEATR